MEIISAAILNCLFPQELFFLYCYPVELGNFIKEIWHLPYTLLFPDKLRCKKLAKSDGQNRRLSWNLSSKLRHFGGKGGIHNTGHWDSRCKLGLSQANRNLWSPKLHIAYAASVLLPTPTASESPRPCIVCKYFTMNL